MLTFRTAVRDTLLLLGPGRKGRWALLVVLAIAVTGFEAVGALLVYLLMTVISGGVAQASLPVIGPVASRFPDTPVQTLQLAIAGLVAAFFVVRSGVMIGQFYVQARLIHNAGARLSTHLLRGYLALPYLTHTQINSSELVRNAFDSVQVLVLQVIKPSVEVVAEFVLVTGFIALLLVVAPQVTLYALLVLGPMVWLLQTVVQPRLKRLGRRSQESRRGTLQAMQQALSGVRDIRLLGRERDFARAYQIQRQTMARTEYLRSALSELPRTLIETGLILMIVVVFVVAVVGGGGGGDVVATLGVFAYAGLRLQPSLRKIVQGLNHVRYGTAIIEDLLKDRQRVDAALRAQQARRVGAHAGDAFQRNIELRDVSFAYHPGAAPALSRVNLTIRAGEFVGICGPTGGGKSTLIDLIAGLLQPTRGQVLVDGRPLEEHPTWWYAQLGVVSQSIYLIDDTIRRNIALGQDDAEIDEELLSRSIERAQLHDVIAQLPAGVQTIVGERGVRLSGGQRQRVAIARALYREPSVIIFDEGTSALDAATEAALVAAINELKVGRTLISVAHRISTVQQADRIIVVQDGAVCAEGGYDELVGRSELFRALSGHAATTAVQA
jgi:ATP-binding cassette, subfamily B, bacterial PglK